MKRLTIGVLAAVFLIGVTSVADAISAQQPADEAMSIEQAWTAWLLGGSSNALLAKDFCGEVVDGRFFLTITAATGATELNCEIPAGVEAVASPFGGIAWAPTDGKNGTALFNSALEYVHGVVPRAVNVQVDGVSLPKGPMICSQPFDIALEPGNSMQQIDPKVKGDSTKAVTCAWMYLVGPFSAGSHTVVIGGKVKGSTPYEVRYNVTVP